ncbi:hypothetical protein KKG45_03380 [bacterium]|nr:hypothetical protein [bacterium]MBU1072268.1 hypothetical protein [bacterium]MBU1675565.1 hypothetical protein [bacterium]
MSRLSGTHRAHGRSRPFDSEGRAEDRPADSPGLAAEDMRFLHDLAARVRESGLASAAILWLASLRPLSFLGSQVLHVAAPVLDVVVPGESASRLARILEKRANLDLLLACLEGNGDPPVGRTEPS